MEINKLLQEKVEKAIKVFAPELDSLNIVIEKSKDLSHGDYATNIAMQLAKPLRKSPLLCAQEIIKNIDRHYLEKIEVAGPGFINFTIDKSFLFSAINEIVGLNDKYGIKPINNEEKINVEFVSANPTGELHLGHARGAAIGDVICRLYHAAGINVTREYYVNDAGVQILNLGRSLNARYLQEFGVDAKMPEDGYQSEKLIDTTKLIIKEVGDSLLNVSEEERINKLKVIGSDMLLEAIKDDLALFRVKFDVYSKETIVRSDSAVEKLLVKLNKFTYESDGAIVLKTTLFGDDKDRVIVKSNGDYTYFLPDIVYHLDKLSRGHSKLVDILGADHHGYIARMKASLAIFNYPLDTLDVEIIQMVRLIRNGEEVKMSKRTGNAITLRELVEEVGVDAVRYFFVSRASSSHLDFDLDLAVENSTANPVYYAHYAYARLFTVLEKANEIKENLNGQSLGEIQEVNLVKHLIEYPSMINDAAATRSPYKVTTYIQKLASLIHSFYTECRIVDYDNLELTKDRLGLAKAAMIVLKNALNLIGVDPKEKM